MLDILDTNLTEEQQKAFTEYLTEWKENFKNQEMEKIELLKEEKLAEIDSLSEKYETELKEEYSKKLVKAIEEVKTQLKAEVLKEMVENDPSMKALEAIKKIVAPLVMNEDTEYVSQLTYLTERVVELEAEVEYSNGAEKLEELLAPYTGKTKKLLKRLVGEGTEEEITERFWNIIEDMKDDDIEEADEEDETEGDEEESDTDESDDEEDQTGEGEEEEGDESDEEEGDEEKTEKGGKKKKGKKSKKDEEDAGDEGEETEETPAEEDFNFEYDTLINESGKRPKKTVKTAYDLVKEEVISLTSKNK